MPDQRDPLHLLVFGAEGSVGRAVVSQALERGHTVRASEREVPAGSETRSGVEWRAANVLGDDLAPLMEGVDAVISALGLPFNAHSVANPPPLYTKGTLNMVKAMQASTVRRLVVISASFVERGDRGPVWFRLPAMTALQNIFDQMIEMERILAASDDIDWTATRPGWLMPAERSGRYEVTEDVIPQDLIRTRTGDLAHFMLDCVEQELWIRGTPAIAARESPSASDPQEVIRSMTG